MKELFCHVYKNSFSYGIVFSLFLITALKLEQNYTERWSIYSIHTRIVIKQILSHSV